MTRKLDSPPYVRISGQIVAMAYNPMKPNELLSLARIEIPWGRETILDPVEGHACTVDLIDLNDTSTYVSSDTALGRPLTVERVQTQDGVTSTETILSGRVTGESAETVHVIHPGLEKPVEATRLRLTVTDLTGILDKLHPDGTSSTRNPVGEKGWRPNWVDLRADEIAWRAGGLITLKTRPKRVWSADENNPAVAQARPWRNDELPSVLTVLRQVFAFSSGLAWPSIRPSGDVYQGVPQTVTDIRLAKLASGKWGIITAPSMGNISAARLVLSRSAHVSSTAAQRPSEVSTVPYVDSFVLDAMGEWKRSEDREQGPIRQPVPGRRLDAQEVNPVEIDLGANLGWWSGADASIEAGAAPGHVNTMPAAEAAIVLCLQEAASRAAALGKFHGLPKMTLYRNYSDGRAPTHWAFFTPTETGACRLSGSKWNRHSSVPRAAQVIGGIIRYDADGWSHEVNLAPCIDNLPRDLTMSALFKPAASATFADIDPNLPIADLPAVSKSEIV